MKMNKLAAGALALALGLGAVAPAVAAEGKTGTGLVEFEYNEKLAESQKYFDLRNEARKTTKLAKERYEAAKKAEAAAEKKYKDLPADKTQAPLGTREEQLKEAEKAVETAKEEVAKAVAEYNTEYAKEQKDEAALQVAKEKVTAKTVELDKAVAKHAELVKKFKDNLPEIDKNKLQPKAQALVDYVKAQQELSNAYGAYGIALDNEKAISDKYDEVFGQLQKLAISAGYFVKVENSKIVVKPSKETKKDNLAELKRAKSDAETAIKAVKLLKELSPEKIKKVEAKLNALVAKNEELVKKADAQIAKLEKKMAFISTAYAAEEDDTDALIKELDQTTGEIKDLIKDTPEDKKANEEKPEEKKPEDKKEEKTPSKKAGNNAKTGIAGIAGVAGILAAASVAYAASKRD